MAKKNNHHPDKILKILLWFCPPGLSEGIEGDLIERWDADANSLGTGKAKMKLMWNVLSFLRPSIIFRNQFKLNLMNTLMWQNYLKVGWRGILKNRFYSAINIFGLALGIGFSYLTFLYVSGELRYDQFHEKADKVFRVVGKTVNTSSNEVVRTSSVTSVPLGSSLLEKYPEIVQSSRIGSFGSVAKSEDDYFSQVVVVADREFFDLFDFETLRGSKNLFVNKNDLVLSEKAADMFFGHQEAVGKPISLMLNDSLHLFKVAAVVDNHHDESSIAFDVLISFENYKHVVGDEVWTSDNYATIETYLLLNDPHSVGFLEEKINDHAFDEAKTANQETSYLFYLQPFTAIHLDNTIPVGIAKLGSPIYVYVLSGIGLLILFMACVNFISLTSGYAFGRIKEIGVRKTMGAFRGQIRNQLMAESFIVSLLATIVGLGLVYFAVPMFNQLINSTIQFNFNLESSLFILILLIVIVVVAGGIPARLLVGLQPVQALKKNISNTDREFAKGGLVVIQFTLSLVLIIGTFIINAQMNYISEKNLGFDKERLYEVSLNNPASAEEAAKVVNLFKSESVSANRIIDVTAAMNDYQEPWTHLGFEQVEGEPIELYFNLVEPAYQNTMGLELVVGRWFDKNVISSGSRQVVVNESLVKYFQWDDALTKPIPGNEFSEAHAIIGVVKDFHFSSLHNKVEPLIIALDQEAIISGVTGLSTYRWPPLYNSMIVKISPGELQPALIDIESIWRKVNVDAPFRGHFVDDLLEAQYANEQRWKKIINYSSVFAFLIAVLGLIGLVKLLLQRKTKEIGIRKVLGSGYGNLAVHFSKGFVGVLVGANLMAWPIAWWASRQWLQSFPYRIELTPLPFVLSAFIVCSGVFMVVCYLTWIASLMRPVDVLKNE